MGCTGRRPGAQRSLLSVGLSGERGSYWSGGRGRGSAGQVHEQSGTTDCQCALGFQQGLHALQAGHLGSGSAGVLAPAGLNLYCTPGQGGLSERGGLSEQGALRGFILLDLMRSLKVSTDSYGVNHNAESQGRTPWGWGSSRSTLYELVQRSGSRGIMGEGQHGCRTPGPGSSKVSGGEGVVAGHFLSMRGAQVPSPAR